MWTANGTLTHRPSPLPTRRWIMKTLKKWRMQHGGITPSDLKEIGKKPTKRTADKTEELFNLDADALRFSAVHTATSSLP